MLYLLGAWLLLITVSLPLGTAILRWAGAGAFERPGERLVLAVWLGVIALGSTLLALSLVMALTPLAGAALGLAAAAALAAGGVRAELRALAGAAEARLLTALLAFAAGVALLAAQPVVWIDTGWYHAGAIRWLSEHGAVEGVGLLNHQFGFGSTWFALAAPFNPDGLREHGAAVMGGFALLMLSLQAALSLSRALRREARAADWFVLGGASLLVLSPVFKGFVSANPDMGVDVLALVAGWAILTLLERREGIPAAPAHPCLSPGPAAVPLLLGIGAMAVKPQAAPLLVVCALFFMLAGPGRLRRLAWIAALGLALGGPWIAYEFVTTGCPAFPVAVCADVPWSVGSETASEAVGDVQGAGTRGSPYEQHQGLDWLANWLTAGLGAWPLVAVGSAVLLALGLTLGRGSAPVFRRAAPWLGLAGLIGLLAFLVRADEILVVVLAAGSLVPLGTRDPAARWLLALGLPGLAVTVWLAPHPRFALGFMAVLLGRLVAFMPPAAWRELRPRLVPALALPRLRPAAVLALAALAAALVPLVRPTTSQVGRFALVLPPALPQPRLAERQVNDVRYGVPPDGLCWASELPCAPSRDEVNSEIVLRDPGAGIGAGFARDPASTTAAP